MSATALFGVWGPYPRTQKVRVSLSRWLVHTPKRKTTQKVHARKIVKKALFSESMTKAYCISVRLPNLKNVMHRSREWVRLLCSTTFFTFGLSFRLYFGGGSPIQISLAGFSDNTALCVKQKNTPIPNRGRSIQCVRRVWDGRAGGPTS